ncbi:MAG: anion-transporting ArsA/GET3 family ATPase [Bradymonadia bacterium]
MSAPPELFDSRLLIAVGSGGVGKTTTSAALALRAAHEGKRVLVLTIDPAKRLANAMGLEELGNEPRPVDLSSIGGTGTLEAAMLDAASSFDELIRSTAKSTEDAERILTNRVYRMMVDNFAGVQEYMAVVRLYDVYESDKYDLIVLDTPPAKHAADFFASSEKAAALFDERIMRWFLPSMNKDRGVISRVFNPGAVVLKLLSFIGGEKFISDLSGFFEAMASVREDLQARGERVAEILKDSGTRYIVVASPDPRRVEEAIEFHQRLLEQRQEVALFVLNRSHDHFSSSDLAPLQAAATANPDDDALAGTVARVGAFYQSSLLGLARRDQSAAQALSGRVSVDRVRTVPAFSEHIHRLEQLLTLSARVVSAS